MINETERKRIESIRESIRNDLRSFIYRLNTCEESYIERRGSMLNLICDLRGGDSSSKRRVEEQLNTSNQDYFESGRYLIKMLQEVEKELNYCVDTSLLAILLNHLERTRRDLVVEYGKTIEKEEARRLK